MPITAASVSLVRVLTPIANIVGKELIHIYRRHKIKWDAQHVISKMSRRVTDINTVKTMLSRDRGVPIDEFYYPSRVVIKRTDSEIDIADTFQDSNIIIEGIVGQGKSILLRHTCNLLLSQGKIPIFIEMRMVASGKDLIVLVLEYLEGLGIGRSGEAFYQLANSGVVSLVLDGFDEIPTHMVNSTVLSIEQLRTSHEALRIIISSRPYQAAQNLPGFDVYELATLKSEDHDPFLKKTIVDSVQRYSFTEAIAQAPNSIQGIITTPLMLTLLYMVYRNEQEIPNTLPKFFDKLFTTVFTSHDRQKVGFNRNRYTGLSETKIQTLFDAFCMTIMQLGGSRTIDYDLFKKAFNHAVKYAPDSECELEDFRREIIETSCLMLDDGFRSTTFLHKSIAEFHAASFIKSSPNATAVRFYDVAPNAYTNWETVLVFLSSIDPYRYGLFYVLKEYPLELEKLTKVLSIHTDIALVEYLNSLFPHYLIGITEFKPSVISSGIKRHHPFLLQIERLISGVVYDQIMSSDTKTINMAIRQSPTLKKENTLTINLRSFVEYMDIKHIWIGLAAIESSMIFEVDKYTRIVEIEQSKDQILNLS